MFFCGQRREDWSGGLIVQPYLQARPTPSSDNVRIQSMPESWGQLKVFRQLATAVN